MVRVPLPTRLSSYRGTPNASSENSPSVGHNAIPSPRTPGPHVTSGSLMLRVHVVKARNLAAKDKGNTSDPYLVLTLGDARTSTVSIPKNLNPEWNETIELPITGLQSFLLEVVCWDKDRWGKEYMGEFDIILEDIFASGLIATEASTNWHLSLGDNADLPQPTWYKLESRKSGKKRSQVTGEVLLSLSLFDPLHSSATPQQLQQRLLVTAATSHDLDGDESGYEGAASSSDLRRELGLDSDTETDDHYGEFGQSDSDSETEHSSSGLEGLKQEETSEKRNRRLKLKRLRKKAKLHAYEFSGLSDLAGVLFIEINRIVDLPPEKNMTRTSFDMDPFVVTSLGKKTYKTRVVRHNLNPVFDEKLVFHVQKHEQKYSLNFAVVDRDKLSGNDFVGTTLFPVESIAELAPPADPETGLYQLKDPGSFGPAMTDTKKSRFRLSLSRSSSSNNVLKGNMKATHSSASSSTSAITPVKSPTLMQPTNSNEQHTIEETQLQSSTSGQEDPELTPFSLPLALKNRDRWEDKYKPVLYIKAKYVPYKALRQQFWRAMIRQYDADDNGFLNKVELTTMLDTLGSTLYESTIDSFFERFENQDAAGESALSHDQVVQSLEDLLEKFDERLRSKKSSKISLGLPSPGLKIPGLKNPNSGTNDQPTVQKTPSGGSGSTVQKTGSSGSHTVSPAVHHDFRRSPGEDGDTIDANDLNDDRGEEHVVEIRECPICHQPRMKKKSDADIITHIATCASSDWRQVNNIVMAGFVTSSQAQRKWYSKVVTKIGYGGYRLGANSANILVQDRITGQINEERMSVYVRLGIRLLYKGIKSRDMEKKRIRKLLRSMSVKQGRKYDDPASAAEIQSFINFHRLDMGEVRLSIDQFKTFNEFFYRELKIDARPCSAPDRPEIVTSPADCRSVVFNTIEDAQKIWVKGREFTLERLLGDVYPEDAKRYQGGALGIFRLAPQDYHRFHIPVDGTMCEPRLIEGEYYTVNPMAIRSALDVYGENIRVVVPIDSVAHGRVMVICVGAMMVGSTIITRKEGEQVKRAEELGYFKFGGSTILLLFEPGQIVFDEDMVTNSSCALETLIRVGMSIGHSEDEVPHTTDMQKNSEDITLAQKEDAQRRIEGSMSRSAGAGVSMRAKLQ